MRTKKCLTIAAIATSAALLLGACGSDSTSSANKVANDLKSGNSAALKKDLQNATKLPGNPLSPSTSKAPCSLASKSDVETAFGGTVAEGKADANAMQNQCSFDITGTSKYGAVSTIVGMQVLVRVETAAESTNFSVVQTALKGEAVSGVGDQAYYTKTGGAIIAFKKGGAAITVQTVAVDSQISAADLKTATIALAKTIVGHL
jgi:hypothetical protein